MKAFERQSEMYSPLGNMSAQGIKRLLGTPTIDQLQTVIREAVQNSWDAATGLKAPVFNIHLRELLRPEIAVMRDTIFPDYVAENGDECLSGFLAKENPWVLELSDIGTSGLGGPTDASIITRVDEDTDFVDFVRNVGTPRDTMHGGGTYGYGKSSLYSLSRCGTIVIDSLTHYKGHDERRVIGCRVASSFVVERGRNKGKYTGRHWWGKSDRSGKGLDPMRGRTATSVSRKIGALERNDDDYGTSILILDPVMEAGPQDVINAIKRTLLWNFWPKMVKYPRRGPAMRFRVFLSGDEQTLPDLMDCPPLDIFAEAMLKLKSGGGKSIDCRSPIKHLGSTSIVKGPKGTRLPGFGPADDGMFPESSRHLALMRPAELVVKYLEGNLLPPSAEWGGLYICSDEYEVEHAFAMAEPPAHDDWIPSSMPRGRAKTYVRVALRHIGNEMEQAVSAIQINTEGGGAELAKLSGRMGSLLNGALGDGISEDRAPTRKTNGRRKRKSLSLIKLEGFGPAEWDGGEVLAWFTFSVYSPESKEIKISGASRIYIDGELSDEAPDGSKSEIRIWMDKNEEFLAEGDTLKINSDNAELIWVGLSIPEDSAVSFTPEILE